MQWKTWHRIFGWVVLLPALAFTLFYLGFVAWPALLLMAIAVAIVKLKK